MRRRRFTLIGVIVILLLDFYVFQAIKTITQSLPSRWRTVIFSLYWILSILCLATFVIVPYLRFQYTRVNSYITAIILGIYIAKLLTALFLGVDDIRRLVQWMIARSATNASGDGGMTRSVFLSWLGVGLGTTIFASLVYGFSNKYNYRIHRLRLAFDNLPASFKGLKIIQLSDIHTGSLADPQAVGRGIDLV